MGWKIEKSRRRNTVSKISGMSSNNPDKVNAGAQCCCVKQIKVVTVILSKERR